MPASRRPHDRRPDVLQPTLLSLALAACFPANGIANPLDPTVVSGGAQFHQHGNTLTVTNTPGAVIEWRGFSVGADEVTRFAQHSAASAVLNRVIGPDPSQILGRLESNGQVFLINPNGILFGRHAVVDVGALVASTLPLSNADFAAGRLNFGHGGGAIDNQGQLHSVSGGRIFLVASDIHNHGVIQAPDGQILLAAGSRANLVDERRPDIQVSLTSPAGGEALNVGRLVAGQLGIYAAAIGNEGVVQATGAHVGANGQIVLRASRSLEVAPGARLSADGAQGGQVRLEAADTVRVAGTVSATGSAGTGGTVDLLGTKVSVLERARIDVSGRDGGGRLVVLGDMASGVATVAGTLLAEATGGGRGGFIETSAAKVSIAENARISTRSAQGDAGLWLIDPADFTIAASGGDITGATLSSQLAGGNVEIQSTTGASGGMGDIHVNDAVGWSANTLTLTALRDININAVMTASGSSKLVLSPASPIGAEVGIAGGGVKVGFNADGSFKGRVDFPGRAGTGFLTIGGESYTVINALGSPGSTTGTDLQGMQGNLAGRYALGANIDASATSGWTSGLGFAPVGAPGAAFSGKFNGLGHTIGGLTINRPTQDYLGLLGRATNASADIRNVGLVSVYVVGNGAVGGLVGSLSGTVTNSYTTGSVANSAANTGGLVGFLDTGAAVSNSYATGTVSGFISTGGLVGQNSGTVTSSYATGTVSGGNGIGGLVGTNSGTVTNSHATGGVSSTGDATGGLVGQNNGTVTSTYATGSVAGTYHTGGLVGRNGSGTVTNAYATGSVSGTSYTGGLVGTNSGTVTNAYATGSVSGTSLVHTRGLVGINDGTVTASFWDTQTSGQPTSAGGTGKTTAQMKDPATFTAAGWNPTVWKLESGAYPTLNGVGGQVVTCAFGVCWDGGAGTLNWFDPLNWSTDALPTSSQTIRIGSLANPVLYAGTGTYLSLTSDAGLTVQSGSLTFTGNVNFSTGTTVTLQAGTLAFNGSTSTLHNLALSGGAAGAAGAVSVANLYTQTGGTWQQIAGTLPAFYAKDFSFSGGTFLRAQGGDGSTGTPYLIDDLYGLQGIASTSLLDKNFRLAGNVNAAGTADWNAGQGFRPIGNSTNAFSGRFDGDGRTISGLFINRGTQGYMGLFGLVGTLAEVRNVGLTGGSVTGSNDTGGLVGQNSGTVTNSFATGSVSGTYRTGGLVGHNIGTVTNSYATGSVSGTYDTGGLVGLNNLGTVTNSYATGGVSGVDQSGGLVGRNGSGTVTDAYATGSVSGVDSTGGLVGYNAGTVTNSFATGSVSGTANNGGLVGYNWFGTVTASFWDTQTSGQPTSAGGTGKTTAQMKDPATFTAAGWNPTVWQLESGAYPTLLTFSGGTCAFGVCWDGGAGTLDWFDPLNWSTDALPTSSQTIRIGSLANPVLYAGTGTYLSLTSDAGLTVQSGSLTFTGDVNFSTGTTVTLQAGTLAFNGATSTLHNLALSGGVLDGAGALTVNGAFGWSGGALGGSGLLGTLGTTTVSGPVLLGKSWDNFGTVDIGSAGAVRFDSAPTTWTNKAGATLTLSGGASAPVSVNGGSGHALLNQGTIVKQAGSAATQSLGSADLSVTNASGGTIKVDSGTLALAGDGTHEGNFIVTAGSVLDFAGGTQTLASGASLSAGAGTLRVSGAVLYVDTAVSIASLELLGGALLADGNFTAAHLLLGGTGLLGGSGAFTVTSSFSRTGGSLERYGDLRITQASGDLEIDRVIAAGNVQLTAAGGALRVRDTVVNATGTATLGGASVSVLATSAATEVTGQRVLVNTGGDLTVQGGSASGASARLRATTYECGGTVGGNVVLTGGAGAGAHAVMIGPDIGQPNPGEFSVGNSIVMTPGAGGHARIHATNPSTIHLLFPNKASGGYTVAGTSAPSMGDSGFFAGPVASPSTAVVAVNLLTRYTGPETPRDTPVLVEINNLAPVTTLALAPGRIQTPAADPEEEGAVTTGSGSTRASLQSCR